MRILFLSPRQALPARSGAKLREYHFMRALAASADLTYLYFRDPDAEPLTVADLPFCREVIGISKPPAYGFANNVRGIMGRWPLPILNYTSPEMSAAVARLATTRNFDIVHLDSIHMIRYAGPATKAIYNWHNIESEAMRRFSATTSSIPRRWYAQRTAIKLETLERQILGAALGHVVCSNRERELLQGIAPEARIAVVENGVDTRYFEPVEAAERSEAHRIVFVGAMDYFPNSDAAIFFATRLWPQIQASLGTAELVIVGANPGPAVRALGDAPGVTVTGIVPDVRPYYRGALAAVVPLRTGGGTRLKILEAMAAGVPVVSTPLGAEGIEATDGENLLLVDEQDAEGWASRLANLAASDTYRSQITAAGLQLVRSRYDWEILGAKLRETYENWLQEDDNAR